MRIIDHFFLHPTGKYILYKSGRVCNAGLLDDFALLYLHFLL